jgi:pimeloyl-ACP methyl ester carboxylesterase
MQLRVDDRNVYAYTGTRAFDAAKPSLVFVHGAAHDHSVFLLQSRYFAHHGWNVLAVDLPGHGRSDAPALASIEAIAEWIGALLDAANIRKAALVGHSMGALASLEAASRMPDGVTHLALLGPAVPMEVSDDLLEAAGRDDHVAFELINGWSHSAGKQLGGNTFPGLWMTGQNMRLLERSRPRVLATDLMACRLYSNGLEAGGGVRCPTLVVLGARDIMAPPKNAQALMEKLANVRVVTLPDTGHALMAEQPDAVLDALRASIRPPR